MALDFVGTMAGTFLMRGGREERVTAPERENGATAEAVPEGLWTKCPKCHEMLYQRELEEALHVCRKCGHHGRLTARQRIAITADPDSFVEESAAMRSSDPLRFPGYVGQLAEDEERCSMGEAMVWGECTIEGFPAVLAVMDFHFRGGSMGAAMGEKFARAAERAAAHRAPFITFACSGGARMQEGIVSLLQMAKTAAVVGHLHERRVPFLLVATDPLTAGVFASFASLGDIIIAEQGALIGFTGPRIIESAFKIKLPPGTHTTEFQYQRGMVDIITSRRELRPLLIRLLRLLQSGSAGGPAGERAG
jgi:acetyl-CoA carboxylase carboxyl transferase subunit beta